MGPPGDDDDDFHHPPPAPFSPDSDVNPAAGSGLDGPVQLQQGGQLLPQYSNPDLPLGMFPQAIEQHIDQIQANNESLYWHGPAPPYPIIPPVVTEEMINPNQETLVWPGPVGMPLHLIQLFHRLLKTIHGLVKAFYGQATRLHLTQSSHRLLTGKET
eukprot:6454044-Amphidinium_carterae.2